jgi:hypothetical protein
MKHVYLVYAEFDPGEYEIVGAYSTRELAEAGRDKLANDPDGAHSRDRMRIESFRLDAED